MPFRFILTLAFLVIWSIGAAGWAEAGLSDRKTLILRGTIKDPRGNPIAKARVVASGGRRASVSSDGAGQYALFVPLGTLKDLVREPLDVRIRIERKGWRFAVPGGDRELMVELRLAAGSDGITRCVVRSNEPRVANATARAIGLDGEATGLAVVDFQGEEGSSAQAASPQPTARLEVLLPGVPAPQGSGGGEPVSAPPPPQVAQGQAPKSGTDEVGAAPSSPIVPVSPPTPSKQVHATSPAAGSNAPKLEASSGATSSSPLQAKDAARRRRDVARERERLEKRARSEAKSRASEEKRQRQRQERAGGELAKREREDRDARWHALRVEVNKVAGASDTMPAPPVAVLHDLAGSADTAQRRGSAAVVPRARVSGDTIPVRPPRALPQPSTASKPAKPAKPERVLPTNVPRVSSSEAPPDTAKDGETGATTGRVVRIHPPPGRQSRSRSRPMVISAPRSALAEGSPSGDHLCACTVEGTVEVQSDKPLQQRVRVAVSLAWYPALADTVELFMGSPRRFKLPPAPCGPQRLKLSALSRTRFEVISREAVAGFRCEDGMVRQARLVLAPQ